MSVIARLQNLRMIFFPANRDGRSDPLSPREASISDQPPIKPLEPLEVAAPEIPKVGTTDAPGG